MSAKLHNFILATTVVMMLFAPLRGIQPSVANAQFGFGGGDTVIEVGPNLIKNTLSEISNAIAAGAQKSLALKEFSLDAIARNLTQNALNQLTADMIKWVNGGMNGNPAFVTNLEEYMQNVVDETAGEFIYGEELSNLCEPVRFQVTAAILTQYVEEGRGTYTPQCTLDDVNGVDIEAFVSGEEFGDSGWLAFFELTVGSNNDPIKAYFNGVAELDERTEAAKERESQELAWSGGFLSKESCRFIEGATGFSRKRCETLTPGALVRDTLSYFVGELPAQRLLQIDELNEVFTSLSSSLSNMALGGTYGLLGLGGNSQYSDNRFGTGNQSYLDALAADQFMLDDGPTENAIEEAIAAEEEYQEIQQEIIDAVDELEEQIEEAEEDNPSCFDLELDDDLADDRDNAEENLEVSNLVLDVLTDIETRLASATTTAAQNVAYQHYFELEKNDLIRTEYDNGKLRLEFLDYDFTPRLEAFEAELEHEIDQCEGSSTTP